MSNFKPPKYIDLFVIFLSENGCIDIPTAQKALKSFEVFLIGHKKEGCVDVVDEFCRIIIN
jgi:hypothetical protein